jgi:type II secretory pathway pseudopilin PulG
METGKKGKYLKYAIGEIVLVVIGILIALSINNWNEYRKDRIKEQAILSQLKEEYNSNLKQLESKITIRNIIITSSQKVLSYIDDPQSINIDSLVSNLSRGQYRPTFDPVKNDIISSNKLNLIQSKRLQTLLSQWESNVYQLTEEELFWDNYCTENKLPYLTRNGLTRKTYYTGMKNNNNKLYLLEQTETSPILFSDTKHTIDYQKILNDPELEALLATAIFSANDANLISQTIKKNIIEILQLINDDLND